MSFENLGRLFARYRGTFPCFSDDVQARAPPRALPAWVGSTLTARVIHTAFGFARMARAKPNPACGLAGWASHALAPAGRAAEAP